MKTLLQCQLGANTFQSGGKVLQKAVYALNQCPIYGAVSPMPRIHESRNQEVEMEVTPLIINLHFPLAKCLLPVPVTLCFGGLEDLLLEGGMLPLGDTTMIPLIGQPPGQSGFLTPLNQ